MEDFRVTQTGGEIQEILNQSPIDTADISALKEADASLQDDIIAEGYARNEADTILQGNIDSEELARQQADAALQESIGTEELRAKEAEQTNATGIAAINEKIPAEASVDNKLVDNAALQGGYYTKDDVDNLIQGLGQNNVIVGELPSTGVANTIYRVPGDGEYSDYMWYGGEWKLLATYSANTQGYQYIGIATPSTNPGTPSNNVFYFAHDAGTYTNFGSLVVSQGVSILKYDGTAWSLEALVGVIDNLTTSDTGNALSAAQGKLIADTTMDFVESENLLDPSTITLGKVARRDTGALTNSPLAYGCTPLIPFTQDLICNSSMLNGGTYWCGCVGYESDGTTKVSTASVSVNGKPLAISKLSHPDWMYVRFNLYPNTDNQYAVYNGSELPSEFIPYAPPYWKMKDAVIPDGYIDTDKIEDEAVTPEKASFFSLYPTSLNLLDPATIIVGYYARKDNGVLTTTSTAYGCTQLIPLTEDIICNSCMETYGSYYAGCVGYDADGTTRLGWVSASARGRSLAIIKSSHPTWAYIRFNLAPNSANEYAVYKGTSLPSEFIPYTPPVPKIEQAYIPPFTDENIAEIERSLGEDGVFPQSVQISLPDKIYAVRGDVLQIFYQGIVVVSNIELYDITVSCSVGKGLYRYYQYAVPEDATLGSKNWTIIVKDSNGNILGTKTCQLVVVDKGTSPSSNKNVLCVGDSLTVGGVWPSEMKRRLTGAQGSGTPAALGLSNISFIGSLSKTVSGTQVNLEGHSGWSWTDYDDAGRGSTGYKFVLDSIYNVSQGDTYTNNGKTYTVTEVNNESGVTILLAESTSGNTITGNTLTRASGSGDAQLTFISGIPEGANPFWNAALQKLDFVNYVENVCGLASGTKIDYAYFLMTWNQVPALDGDWDTFIGRAKTVFDALHADYPDCKIKLMGVEFPYPPTFISATASQNTAEDIRRVAKMNGLYQELANSDEESGTSGDAYNTFVEFVNVSSQFDSKYNMTNSERDANTRNSTYKERFTNNSIHPGTPGYLQIGDVAYRNICNELQ